MRKPMHRVLLCLALVLGTRSLSAHDPSVDTFFVINSPSSASQGSDSILIFTTDGQSAVFLSAERNFRGLRDIACKPKRPSHVMVSHGDFSLRAHGFLLLDQAGHVLHTIPAGTLGSGMSIAYDHIGNLYVADDGTIFKNDIELARLPPEGSTGRIAVDSKGNVYVSEWTVFPSPRPRVFRIDPAGNVTVFADESQGLDRPYGLAIDSENNVFVANNPPSAPAFILKFDAPGAASLFATDISFQPGIASMVFDRDDNLYATLAQDSTILKFTKGGASSVFADASDGLDFPEAIARGPVLRRNSKVCR